MSHHTARKQRQQRGQKTATVVRKRSENKQIRSQTPPAERAAPKTEPPPLEGELLKKRTPRIPRRLDTVAEWQREIARVYRAMRKGRMPKEDGTKLVWVADIGVKVAKYIEEMAQFAERTRILEAIMNERGQPLPAIEHEDATVIEASTP